MQAATRIVEYSQCRWSPPATCGRGWKVAIIAKGSARRRPVADGSEHACCLRHGYRKCHWLGVLAVTGGDYLFGYPANISLRWVQLLHLRRQRFRQLAGPDIIVHVQEHVIVPRRLRVATGHQLRALRRVAAGRGPRDPNHY